MTNPVMVVRDVKDGEQVYRHCYTWCPACDQLHPFRVASEDGTKVEGRPSWDWDGNMEVPTFSPSLLVFRTWHACFPDGKGVHYEVCADPDACDRPGHYVSPEGPAHVMPCPNDGYGNCHSYLKAGRWEFLADSAHRLAGTTVDMVPVPDWVAGF